MFPTGHASWVRLVGMGEFPFDGLDIEPSPVQAELIVEVRKFIADADIP
jgi:hypothetical protein